MLEFILFMVQQPDDQVYFYLSTPHGGLQKAFVSIPSKNLVLPLERVRGGTALPARGPLLERPERDPLMEAERLNQIDALLKDLAARSAELRRYL